MCVSTLASEAVAGRSLPPPPRIALLRDIEPAQPLPSAALPSESLPSVVTPAAGPLSLRPLPSWALGAPAAFPLAPKWSPLWLLPGMWASAFLAWQVELRRAPVERLDVREVYARLARLPRLDRVGRFAHIDFPRSGWSSGPELRRVALEPPREYYARAQELTPSWSIWYKPSVSGDRWAVGFVTGTRFLIAQQSGTVVDPITSEARWAFFLP